MPPKDAKKNAKALSPEEQSMREGELKRAIESFRECKENMEPFAPFIKKLKSELEAIKAGDQLEIPVIPLFVYPASIQQYNREKHVDAASAAATGVINKDVAYAADVIDFKVCRSLFTILETYQWLKEIQLYHCGIGDNGAMLVAEFLKTYKPNPRENSVGIEKLELPENNIGPVGASYLGKVLTQNETVKELNLNFNPLGDEGAANLGNGLKWNSTVEILNLRYCNIGQQGGEAVGKFIVRSSSVKELSLRGNPMEAHGIIQIARSLAKNAYLVKLDLADTGFGIDLEAIEALRDGIESNDSLTTVDLDLNSIVPAGVQLLLEMLRTKPRLTKFDVYQRISEVVFKDIMDQVVTNGKIMKKKNKKGRGKKK